MPSGNRSTSDGDELVYIGGATVRKVSAADLENAGIPKGRDLVWDVSNHKRIPVSDLTNAMVDLLLKSPREFVVAKAGRPAPLPVDQPNPASGE